MTVYLPLAGPNTRGKNAKGCYVTGWNEPAYKGVDLEHDGWLGLRLDARVVVDCDCACVKVNGAKPDVCETPEASRRALHDWLAHTGKSLTHTRVRKTPHGFHLFYKRPLTADVGKITSRKLSNISPTLELKTGIGDQVVYRAPGYNDMGRPDGLALTELPFDASWLPEAVAARPVLEWSDLPDGIGDSFMISVAGKLREWGADESTILACLVGVNTSTMSRPMPDRSLRRIARSAARYAPNERAELDIFECPKCSTTWKVR